MMKRDDRLRSALVSGSRGADAAYRSRRVFLDSTEVIDGSWWACLSRWLREQSSGEIEARTIAHSLADAPGSYVLGP